MTELKIGKMTSSEVAEWFGMKLKSYQNKRKMKLEQLAYYCEFEENS